MKILVFGAGVLGCNLARNLCRAGKDVTLLARGKWAEEIKQNGLRIKNQLLPFPSVTHIPVVTELSPDAAYDVIFVVVRYTQLENLLEPLRKSKAENIVFVGNNARMRWWHSCRRKTSCSRFPCPPGIGKAAASCRLT